MRARSLAIAVLLLTAPVAAEEQASMELLEFLGSFETADGKWIDPTRIDVVAVESQKKPVAPDAPAKAEEKTDE